MLVHQKRKPRYQIEMPLTSLIDIVFMLLIYFMLTANFIVEEGIDIKLPQADQSAAQEEVTEEITVFVNNEGSTYIRGELVPESELMATLQEMIGDQPDRLVIIKADRTVVLNSAVRVMDIAKSAGAGRLCIATEKE